MDEDVGKRILPTLSLSWMFRKRAEFFTQPWLEFEKLCRLFAFLLQSGPSWTIDWAGGEWALIFKLVSTLQDQRRRKRGGW